MAKMTASRQLLVLPPQHAGVNLDDEPPARGVEPVAADRPGLARQAPVPSQSYDSPGTGRTARVVAPS